jgi:hypothetical protein
LKVGDTVVINSSATTTTNRNSNPGGFRGPGGGIFIGPGDYSRFVHAQDPVSDTKLEPHFLRENGVLKKKMISNQL